MGSVSDFLAKRTGSAAAVKLKATASLPASNDNGETAPLPPIPGLVEIAKTAAQSARKRSENTMTAKELIEAIPAAETQYGDFVTLTNQKVIPLESEEGADYIRGAILDATGKFPSKTALDDARAVIRMNCRKNNSRVVVANRVAKTESGYAYDLGNAEVHIRDSGWRIEPPGNTPFLRPRGYGIIKTPPIKPKNTREALTIWVSWAVEMGVPRSRALLFVAALVDWLRNNTAHPILNIYGPAGSGKTILAVAVLMLLDPTESGGLPSIKLDSDSIAAAAQCRYVLTFDNVSRLSADAQDLLCQCSTGGEIIARRLYTNSDAVIMPIHRPVLITSVQCVVTRADLMSRTIPIELPARAGGARRSEGEIKSESERWRPELLGALLELLAAGAF